VVLNGGGWIIFYGLSVVFGVLANLMEQNYNNATVESTENTPDYVIVRSILRVQVSKLAVSIL